MKKYIVDTNVILRFLLRDNEKLFRRAKEYFTLGRSQQVTLILVAQVLFELDYVLRGVYSLNRRETADILGKLVKDPVFKINDRSLLIQSVEKYKTVAVDLVDIYLFYLSKKNNALVLSFDRDFDKLEKS